MGTQNGKSPLQLMTSTTPTSLWNDSCSIPELEYALEHGAVGATSNPVIVGDVLKKEMPAWKDRICAIAAEMPKATEDEVAWRLIEEMSVKAARLLLPGIQGAQGKERPAFDPNGSPVVPGHRGHRSPGSAFQRACTKHDRENTGDKSGD